MVNCLLLVLILLTLISNIINQEQVCPKYRCASNGRCTDSQASCEVAIFCPDSFPNKPNQFTCSKLDTNSQEQTCPGNLLPCWDLSCVSDRASLCPTMPTCPSTNGVRCPDNSCVSTPDDCPKYVQCPSFIPVRCPNGDCRKSLKDCPSLIQCPPAFSILCNDGSCRMTTDECNIASVQTQCTDETMTRCPDGSCTSSKFLCPTPKTCPGTYVLCWNGSCAVDYPSCTLPGPGQSNSCSSTQMISCPIDGSCRSDISLCPTAQICPVDKPVRCWDFSCKESVGKCPAYQDCPDGSIQCPDGTCSSVTVCGTQITCSMDAPFKCYDNTCRKNPKDCPDQIECPTKYPILCWDGKCVANRFDCLPPQNCGPTEPVKCPDNMCRKTADECKIITDCPTGFMTCADGSCKRQLADCITPSCPLNFPLSCPNGMCVSDTNLCDKPNGCPYYSPNKCYDGSCSASVCPQSQNISCPAGTIHCPDGSCLSSTQICPSETGCPQDTPLLCADGTCIDNTKSCQMPICPSFTPIKCPNGLCVVSLSSCSSTFDITTIKECIGLIPCSDGTCAKNPEECKPVFRCAAGYVRCNDGSCRTSLSFCPLAKTCPASRSYRCDDGSCAIDSSNCLNTSGCPLRLPNKCSNSGLCALNSLKCNEITSFPLANGCDSNISYKCPSGQCVFSASSCTTDYCTNNQAYCDNDGTCVSSLRYCSTSQQCVAGLINCPINVKCRPSYLQCENASKCPVSTPFRCIDGSCKKYPSIYSPSEAILDNTCDIGIQCPDYKPYLCADGSCAEKNSFCLSLFDCPAGYVRCFDRTCATSSDLCNNPRKKCPARNPILCGVSGNCVSTIFDCSDDTCPPETPILCLSGQCVSSPRQCVINDQTSVTICDSTEITCYDGTCRKRGQQCPLYPGCITSRLPFKCPDGSCSVNSDGCISIPACSSNTSMLCEDGICRDKCPDFNGCPNTTPLLCPTGVCVNTESECAGLSNCEVDTPFRCVDGSCAENISSCPTGKTRFTGTDIKIFTYPGLEIDAEIILGEDNDIIGSIKIPSNTFYKVNNNTFNNSTNNIPSSAVLSIKSVSSNRLRNTSARYNQTRQDDLVKVYPYGDANNIMQLEYEYSVLSPVIEVTLNDNSLKLSNLIVVTLAYDFPIYKNVYLKDNGLDISLDALRDVCLGKLNNTANIFECVPNFNTVANVNFILNGGFDSAGIYAVIMAPVANNSQVVSVPNFIVKYFLIILISSLVAGLVIFIGFYIFFRIYRYRHKYKESREESKKFESKMQEMQMIGTSHLGQTMGDNLDNIIYTSNPSFRMQKEESKDRRIDELQHLQENMNKRYRLLEKNNDQLKKTFETLHTEYDRLREYKEQIKKSKDDGSGKIIITEEECDL